MTRRKGLLAVATVVLGLAALAPVTARAYRSWKAERRQARIAEAWQSVQRGQDFLSWNPMADEAEEAEERAEASRHPSLPEQDDPMLRGLVNAAEWGFTGPAIAAQTMRAAALEARRAPDRMPGAPPRLQHHKPADQVPVWRSLGPTDTAKKQYNGDEYVANDTGRAQAIRVDPADATGNTVYLAVSGGGLWKTTNYSADPPSWAPLTDVVGNLSVGAMDLFPGATTGSHTLWLGLGDFTDAPAGVLIVSRDSGATWSAPITLSGHYNDGAGGHVEPQPTSTATRIRDLKVDPQSPDVVLVATDVGLFISRNATAASPTFTLVDLPNPGTGVGALVKESAWSIAFLGATAGGPSTWLLSGVQAVSSATTAYANLAPGAGAGSAGTPGDLWKSTDGGLTWTSLRAAGKITAATLALTQEVGRMALATGTPTPGDPTKTVVYAQCGNANETSSLQLATLKSTDSGATFTVVAKNTDSSTNGKLTNPTLNGDCNTLNVAHAQAWYNLAIAVDPTDPNRVIMGGNLCAARSIDGGQTWQNVANWLPLPGYQAFGINQGNTSTTPLTMLPYVHADWHALWVDATGRVYAGTDGGLFTSTTVWDPTVSPTVMPVTWRSTNAGLVTHLHYSLASGDPVLGNHRFLFTGLQDNGTRFRDTGTSTKWNQVVGGDGVGTAISIRPDGTNQVFFQSLPGSRRFCRPGEPFFVAGSFDPAIAIDCNSGLLHPNQGPDTLATEYLTWNTATNATLPTGDTEPFLMRYAPMADGQGSLLTTSTLFVWRLRIDPTDVFSYQAVAKLPTGRSPRGLLTASRTTSVVPLPAGVGNGNTTMASRVYGVPLSGGLFFVGVENAVDPSTGVVIPWAWVTTTAALGSTGNGGALQQMTSTSSLDFPKDPTHLGGAALTVANDLTHTFIASSVTPLDTTNQPIRDDVGRIFKTTDTGATWTSIATVASGMPNVPVNVVRFDPSDPSDQTIWAGTDLGVYRTTNGGQTWERYGAGLPMVRVTDMSFAKNGSLVRISTYGRGVWEIYPHTTYPSAVGTGDWDQNGQVDFFDLMATAARLGTAPADAVTPAYDSTVDLSNHGAIDETDLTGVLAKFGGAP